MSVDNEIWESLVQMESAGTHPAPLGWGFSDGTFRAYGSLSAMRDAKAEAYLLGPEVDATDIRKGKEMTRLPFGGMRMLYGGRLEKDTLETLKLYWPLSALRFSKRKKPFVIIHVAASLDGKMATHCGDSKWIGNPENLVHAHRLRALVDGIMVGAGTVRCDQPSLNVRHVKGSSPTRLIISNQSQGFPNLKEIADARTLLVRHADYQREQVADCFDDAVFYTGENDRQKTETLLRQLYQKGIRSILIEGGAKTISGILRAGGADALQIHYAPIVLGSGKSVVELPRLDKVADAKRLKDSFWTPMGDSFMITGAL